MTTQTVGETRAEPASPIPPRSGAGPARPRWWLQLMLVIGLYWTYARIRDLHGLEADDPGPTRHAFRNGRAVLHVEQWLHLDVERSLQHAVLHLRWLLTAADVFYGSAHFGVTLLVFLWLLFRAPPHRFYYWRNLLAVATSLALVGFATFPTMPPRLFPSSYGYVDTLHAIGGLWSYNAGVLEHISDPYAAMPSLHIVWASWCTAVLWQRSTSRLRPLLLLYPLATVAVVLVSANHWVLDLVVGLAIFALAWALVWAGGQQRAGSRLRAGSGATLAAALPDRGAAPAPGPMGMPGRDELPAGRRRANDL